MEVVPKIIPAPAVSTPPPETAETSHPAVSEPLDATPKPFVSRRGQRKTSKDKKKTTNTSGAGDKPAEPRPPQANEKVREKPLGTLHTWLKRKYIMVNGAPTLSVQLYCTLFS